MRWVPVRHLDVPTNRFKVASVRTLPDVRPDRTRTNCVHADIPSTKFTSCHPSKYRLAALGSGIAGVSRQRKRLRTIHRSRNDDASPARCTKMRDGMFYGQERSGQIGINRGMPFFDGHFLNWTLHAVDACVREDGCQAPERVNGRIHGSFDRSLVPNIGNKGNRLTSRCADLSRDPLGGLTAHVDDRHCSSLMRASTRGRLTDS